MPATLTNSAGGVATTATTTRGCANRRSPATVAGENRSPARTAAVPGSATTAAVDRMPKVAAAAYSRSNTTKVNAFNVWIRPGTKGA